MTRPDAVEKHLNTLRKAKRDLDKALEERDEARKAWWQAYFGDSDQDSCDDTSGGTCREPTMYAHPDADCWYCEKHVPYNMIKEYWKVG